jgi:hypothetical protein
MCTRRRPGSHRRAASRSRRGRSEHGDEAEDAALLALLVALAAVPGEGRAQDGRPDLMIEIVGLDSSDARVTSGHQPSAEHTLTLQRRRLDWKFAWDGEAGMSRPPTAPAVGRIDGDGVAPIGPDRATLVAQTAVNFDLAKLDEIPPDARDAATARLTFHERPWWWTVREDRPEDRPPACVAALGIATTPRAGPSSRELYPNEPFADAAGSAREWGAGQRVFRHDWDVSAHVRRQLARPEDESLRFGYVLRGEQEALDADDESACMSTLSNFRLEVTYVVASN